MRRRSRGCAQLLPTCVTRGNKTPAAKILDVGRRPLYRKDRAEKRWEAKRLS